MDMECTGCGISTEVSVSSPNNNNNTSSNASSVVNVNHRPLCAILRQSWNEALSAILTKRPSAEAQSSTTTRISSSTTKRHAPFPSVLSILQSNAIQQQATKMEHVVETYDFDLSTTLTAMANSRSRAFILLDLSTIVQTHTKLRKQFKKHMQFTYSTRHNANPKLLQLLASLNVMLKVSTKHDLCLCKTFNTMDDFDIVAKPTSFYRSLNATTYSPIAVDGAVELERIYGELARIVCKRRRGTDQLPTLKCVLKLNAAPEQGQWEATVMELDACAKRLSCEIVGFAAEVDLGDTMLMESLVSLVEFVKSRQIIADPELHVSGTSLQTNNNKIEALLARLQQHCKVVSLDVSSLLVSNAAALCARIIGVKDKGSSGMHYYIDDGCYGSLSNYSKHPIPLKQCSGAVHGATTEHIDDNDHNDNTRLATVFGETCDGLDKICSDIPLPPLSRDDWLVFTDLGFCREGTGFNGFSPPDVACCVLGGYYA